MLTADLMGNGRIRLTDLRGNMLFELKIQKGGTQNRVLEIGQLPAGVYLVELTQADGKSVLKKLIVQ
jgi:hypothetical protein